MPRGTSGRLFRSGCLVGPEAAQPTPAPGVRLSEKQTYPEAVRTCPEESAILPRRPHMAAAALTRPAFPLTSAHRFRGEERRWREGKQLGGSGEEGRKAERPLCLNPAERKAVAC